jgi:hypothetical protein
MLIWFDDFFIYIIDYVVEDFRSGQFTPFVPLLPLPQTETGVLGGGHSPL